MLRLRLRCTSDGAGDVETVPVAVLHAAGLRVARFPTPAHGDDAHPLLDGVLASDATVPRAKRRKLCKGDKVVRMDEDALLAAF